jgi:hypothetical protein
MSTRGYKGDWSTYLSEHETYESTEERGRPDNTHPITTRLHNVINEHAEIGSLVQDARCATR